MENTILVAQEPEQPTLAQLDAIEREEKEKRRRERKLRKKQEKEEAAMNGGLLPPIEPQRASYSEGDTRSQRQPSTSGHSHYQIEMEQDTNASQSESGAHEKKKKKKKKSRKYSTLFGGKQDPNFEQYGGYDPRYMRPAMPIQPMPMTPQQHQQITLVMTNYMKQVANMFKVFYDSSYALATGMCLFSSILFPITSTTPEVFIPVFATAGWNIFDAFHVLMTLSLMVSFNELDDRRDIASVFFVLTTLAAFVSNLIANAIDENMAISQFDSAGGKYGQANWYKSGSSLTTFQTGDWIKYTTVVNIRAYCMFAGFLLKLIYEMIGGSTNSTTLAKKTSVGQFKSNEQSPMIVRSYPQNPASPIQQQLTQSFPSSALQVIPGSPIRNDPIPIEQPQ